jgi:hypothetical protein
MIDEKVQLSDYGSESSVYIYRQSNSYSSSTVSHQQSIRPKTLSPSKDPLEKIETTFQVNTFVKSVHSLTICKSLKAMVGQSQTRSILLGRT